MKTLLKTYLLCFFLLSDFVLFAQLPTDDQDGDLQGDDLPAVPINSKLLWLALAGILFVGYRLKTNTKTSSESSL